MPRAGCGRLQGPPLHRFPSPPPIRHTPPRTSGPRRGPTMLSRGVSEANPRIKRHHTAHGPEGGELHTRSDHVRTGLPLTTRILSATARAAPTQACGTQAGQRETRSGNKKSPGTLRPEAVPYRDENINQKKKRMLSACSKSCSAAQGTAPCQSPTAIFSVSLQPSALTLSR